MNQLKIFSQTPYEKLVNFNDTIIELARNTEKYNYTGVLIVYSSKGYDPWITTTKIIENSKNITPLIAVQPYALTPEIFATRIESIYSLYNRKIDLNIITGNATRLQQSSEIAHSPNRYDWLCEFISETKRQINTDFFNINKLGKPKFYLSGSSNAGFNSSIENADGYLTIPGPIEHFKDIFSLNSKATIDVGISLGIITRPTSSEAWEYAKYLYPYNRVDAVRAALNRNSKMNSVNFLAQLITTSDTYDNVYWLGVYRTGINNYPYLVGSYVEVADYLTKYISLGINTIVLNGPFSEEEFYHRQQVFNRLYKKIRKEPFVKYD